MSDWSALQGLLAGELLLPGAPGYEAARAPAIANFRHVRPQAVVRCSTPADVAEALTFARRLGLPVAPRSGGHCFAGRSSTDGIVIDVTPMSAVSVSGGVAAVGAGARLDDLYGALAEHGVTIPAGCGPTVGIAGLTLGGGLGILGRRHGLTSDRLRAASVVLADGRVIDCDGDRDAELFWALRGGGAGRLGVVTALVFDTVPAPDVTTFELTWPHADAAAVAAAWQDWAPDAPDELHAALQLAAAGEQPPVVNLFGALLGGAAEALELIDRLAGRAGAEPASAAHAQLPYRDAKRALAGAEDSEPRHRLGKSEFFRRPLPPEAIATLVENLARERTPGETRELNFTPMGGSYNRVPAGATAFVHRAERFLLEHVLYVAPDPSAAERDAAARWVRRSWACARRWGSGRVYPNFPDPELTDAASAYFGPNYERLRRVERKYDG